MLDVLSQKEIDALVNSMNSGEAPTDDQLSKDSVHEYDFRTANKFTKEHIRTIEAIIKSFAHLLSNYFVGMLRTSCEIEILSMEEMSFTEFNNSVPALSVISVISMSPMEGSAIFEISKETACSIFSRVLGGSKTVPGEKAQFTEIEMAIMERVVWQILKYYDDAWDKMMTVNSSLERLENSMQFAQVSDGNEAVLVATLNIQLGGENGLASFCFPWQMLNTQLKKLSPKVWYTQANGKKVEAFPEKAIKSLSSTNVELRAVFNTTDARAEDIIRLQPGDVITLDHKEGEALTILVQNKEKYKAVYGKQRGRYAIKIQSELKGDEQDG
jgi:flagellar motor switch protein FliM